eukprot:CAMPEP_0114626764 /NCGR_PEP_ID=MMETSP0168-20121206/11952_1 /TAXON_ID=95228 ORGANISM="Vannella sp., Strain DIVA3 517/6/12" /NCGR_SAMPLE_ID=MMETSP0168 /ASSEMBLY_ACC=CAM_ASM_000044 /LENGTH=266 /DNA_ID=CAMNT_0001838083 /DNA_START=66 /DNA_END=866 /DNA_ORIENTATION=+
MGALHDVDIAAAAASTPSPAAASAPALGASPATVESKPAVGGSAVSAASIGVVAKKEDPSIYDDPPVPLPTCSPEPPRRAARRPPTAVKDSAITRAVEAEIEKERKKRDKLRSSVKNSSALPFASLHLLLFALCGVLYSVASRGCGRSLSTVLPSLCDFAAYRPAILLLLPTLVVLELLTAIVTVLNSAVSRPCTPGASPAQLPGGLQDNMIVNMLLSTSPTGAAVKESLANAMTFMTYMTHIRLCVSVGVFALVASYSVLALTGY